MMPTAGTMPKRTATAALVLEVVGSRKLTNAMARTTDAMAPGCVHANKQMHDFIHAQRHRKEARAVARFRKKRQSRRF